VKKGAVKGQSQVRPCIFGIASPCAILDIKPDLVEAIYEMVVLRKS
jgi:hypothetical protein